MMDTIMLNRNFEAVVHSGGKEFTYDVSIEYFDTDQADVAEIEVELTPNEGHVPDSDELAMMDDLMGTHFVRFANYNIRGIDDGDTLHFQYDGDRGTFEHLQ